MVLRYSVRRTVMIPEEHTERCDFDAVEAFLDADGDLVIISGKDEVMLSETQARALRDALQEIVSD